MIFQCRDLLFDYPSWNRILFGEKQHITILFSPNRFSHFLQYKKEEHRWTNNIGITSQVVIRGMWFMEIERPPHFTQYTNFVCMFLSDLCWNFCTSYHIIKQNEKFVPHRQIPARLKEQKRLTGNEYPFGKKKTNTDANICKQKQFRFVCRTKTGAEIFMFSVGSNLATLDLSCLI